MSKLDDFINGVMAESAITEKATMTLSIGEHSIEIPTTASSVFHILQAIHMVLEVD